MSDHTIEVIRVKKIIFGGTGCGGGVGRGGSSMDWGTELWDQFEVLERHTQWGLDLLDRYVKFVKERTEVEQAYAKQLR